jgi:hypothetical protein
VSTVLSAAISLCIRWCDANNEGGQAHKKWGIVCSTLADWIAVAQASSFVGIILWAAPMHPEAYSAKRMVTSASDVELRQAKKELAQVEAKLATARKLAKTTSGKEMAGLYYHTHAGVLNTGISVNGDEEIVGPPHKHSKLPWGTTTYYKTTASAEDMEAQNWKAGTGDLEGMIVDEDGELVEDKLADGKTRSETHTHNFALQGGGVIATANFTIAEGEATPVKDGAEGMKAKEMEMGKERAVEHAKGLGSSRSRSSSSSRSGSSMSNNHRETPMHPVTSDKVPSM